MKDQWLFSKEELDQLSTDDATFAEEQLERSTGCFFIQCIGYRLRLNQLIIATATVYFHRFYTRRSSQHFELKYVAATCIYLACKVEDSIYGKKIKDIIEACLTVRYGKPTPKKASDRRDGRREDRQSLDDQHPWYENDKRRFMIWRKEIEHLEWIVLETLCFDLTVDHPHQHITEFVRQLQSPRSVANTAWALANDSLREPLCLLYHPRLIAAACVFAAYKSNGDPPPESNTDWHTVITNPDDANALVDILQDLALVYPRRSQPNTPSRNGQPAPTAIAQGGGHSSHGAGNHETH